MGRMKAVKFTAVIVVLCLLSGCADVADSVSRTVEQAGSQIERMDMEGHRGDIDYEVPVSIPKILINQVGYQPESDKTAVFRGESLPSDFLVIDAASEKVVYTGRIEAKGYNEELEEYHSYGSFSEVKTPGTYYIMADVIGMSYPFEIKENIYDDMLLHSFARYAQDSGETATDIICETLSALLLSYELYADSYTDDMNIPESGNGIPDLLDVMRKKTELLMARQNAGTGKVMEAGGKSVESAEAGLYFAAALAKFANTYKIYDAAYAELCLQSAKRAFHAIQNEMPALGQDMIYFAAAELYRATGEARYYTVLGEYASPNARQKAPLLSGFFYGDVTYLSTTYMVDTKICEALIENLMNRVERIAGDSKTKEYMTRGNKEQSNNSELLAEMEMLSVVNYIIANHEYDTVLENYLHYFLGRNTKCISYVTDAGYTPCTEEDAIMADAIMNARFLCMLSAIK